MTKGWTLRRFNYDDFPRIAEFRRSFPRSLLVKCDEPEYHEWKFCDNPRVFNRLVLTLLKLGFLPWTKIPLICYKNELGNKILSKAYKWHFTMGDSDGI